MKYICRVLTDLPNEFDLSSDGYKDLLMSVIWLLHHIVISFSKFS